MLTLSDAITARSNNKRITVSARVSGVADNVYNVPYAVLLSCGTCKKHIGNTDCYSSHKTRLEVPYPSLLKFVDVSERSFKPIIQSIKDTACSNFKYAIAETKSLSRIFIIDPQSKEGKIFTCYFVGTDLEANQTYEFIGTVVADPKTQNATAIFTSAKKVLSQIESFSITDVSRNQLMEFCVPPNASAEIILRDHILPLYDSYAANITHVYDRYDLHLAIDLVFHSPLSFDFDGEHFHKGWVDAAIVGDTRLGKNFVAEGLHKYFGVGEIVSGENSTLAGLIGGLKRIDKNYVVKWGAFPRNDGGLVIVDETAKLSHDAISRLNTIRSEGKAEIQKIVSSVTDARVRTLFIMNTRSGKNISQYPFGIEALLSVFKYPASISRLDFALIVSGDEADRSAINRKRIAVPEKFSQESERQLIYWIWSRKHTDIKFSPQAIDRVYMLALDLANTYSFDIALIQPENIRYKLAKLAVCFAGRLYSNRYSGKHLFVDAVHVECAWSFFTMIYKKKASSYYAFSVLHKSLERSQSTDGIKNIDFYFQSFPTKRIPIFQALLMSDRINPSDIRIQADIAQDIALEIISKLMKNKLIERRGLHFVKVEKFSEYLRNKLMEGVK